MKILLAVTLGLTLGLVSQSQAQTAETDRSGKSVTARAELRVVPAALLMRVDEGVFELEVGKSIDLTERKVLLNISFRRAGECCEIRINGQLVRWTVGGRIDLKRENSTQSYFSDRDQCFLDVVDLLIPKGTTAKATFRLHCI